MVEVTGTLDEIEAEMRRVLARRTPQIQDGRLNGKHWLSAIAEEAGLILRRRRAAEQRRFVAR